MTQHPSLHLLDHEISKWVYRQSERLTNSRTKFCSYNAVRFLYWANEVFETSPIVANFCGLNATEEAVVAFISAAKANGMKKQGTCINLHDHTNKAIVSIFAQRLTQSIESGQLSVALHKERDCLAFRIETDKEPLYGDLNLGVFRVGDDPGGNIQLGELPSLEGIEQEVNRVAEARNKLLYATKTSVQTGFVDPAATLVRDTMLSLGLIWAATDMYINKEKDQSFLKAILSLMVDAKGRLPSKKCKCEGAT